MKNVLKFAMACCLVFVFIQANAQVKFGPKGGLNLSTMTEKSSGFSLDTKTLVGFNVGVVAEIPITDNFALQPGVLYSAKGTKYSTTVFTITVEGQTAPKFIEIPVNVLLKFDLGAAKLLLFAGPYLGYAIGGTNSSKSANGSDESDIKFGSGNDKDMKPMDFGLNFGGGLDINNFQITAQYGLGMANLAPVTTNSEESKISVIGVSVAYLFGGR